MDWIEALNEIRNAKDNNRLVIFVGAGVSRNSGVPDWNELVELYADKIGYKCGAIDPCLECDSISELCSKKTENYKCKFTQEELLRIPEYVYQHDKINNNNQYYSVLNEVFGKEYLTNPIHDEIFNAFPHHIITTNY